MNFLIVYLIFLLSIPKGYDSDLRELVQGEWWDASWIQWLVFALLLSSLYAFYKVRRYRIRIKENRTKDQL